MKKILLATFVFFFSCQLLLAQEKMYINSGNGVNLREGAGTNYNIKTSIPSGSQVKVLSNDGDWAKVEYGSETGYISSRFLSENKPESNRNNTADNNQKKSSSSGNSNSGNSRSKASSSNKHNWGIGIRGGDPAGLTLKKYNGGTAWELNIGYTYYWGGYGYRDAFYDYRTYRDYRNVDIKAHYVKRAIGIQLRHLWQKDLQIEGLPGLQWYYGLGGQIKSVAVEYRFKYEDPFGKTWDNVYDTAHFINLGVDGILGLEYTFREVPLSLFTDVNLFLEIFRNTFNIHPQAGIGIRYNF